MWVKDSTRSSFHGNLAKDYSPADTSSRREPLRAQSPPRLPMEILSALLVSKKKKDSTPHLPPTFLRFVDRSTGSWRVNDRARTMFKGKHRILSARSAEATKNCCQIRQGLLGSRLVRAAASLRPSASLVTHALSVRIGPRPAITGLPKRCPRESTIQKSRELGGTEIASSFHSFEPSQPVSSRLLAAHR